MTNDGFHTYTYDAEGNILQVDGGSTASYTYDALNNRVRSQTGSTTYEYMYDYAGRRTSSWYNPSSGNPGAGNAGRIYWDNQEFALRAANGQTYFDQRDFTGTIRMRTTYSGAVDTTETSLPFGDAWTLYPQSSNSNESYFDFATLDHDTESNTDHAQFRNYSPTQGRWLAPDPYDGSYDITNPQSLNRYAYVLNNPLSFTDPLGLNHCVDAASCGGGGGDCANDPNCDGENGPLPGYGGGGCSGRFCDPWGGPPGSPLDAIAGEEEAQWLGSGSIPWYRVQGGELMLLAADPWFYVPTPDPNSFTFLQIPTWVDLGTTSASSGTYSYFGGVPGSGGGGGGPPRPTSIKATLPGTNYCGPGGSGSPMTRVDGGCASHDLCYQNAGAQWYNNVFGTGGAGMQSAIQACNAQLCGSLRNTLNSSPTLPEMFQAPLVGTAFGCTP
jgi:RHS repeat-associated protein